MQSDEGIYVCEASNENGKVEQKSNVTVVGGMYGLKTFLFTYVSRTLTM